MIEMGVTHRFFDRGDPAAWDFTVGDFTTNGAWHNLILAGIVPAGGKAVLLRVYVKDNLVDQVFYLREKGNVNIINMSMIVTQVANVRMPTDVVVACDVNRTVEYNATDTVWTNIFLAVKGWWK